MTTATDLETQPAPGPEAQPSAADLDARDPLRRYRDLFVGADDPALPAYLDGNSLGRPVKALAERYRRFVDDEWGGRLIRGWDETWLRKPFALGDRIGAATLGAAPGQTVVADSTTVSLYKLLRAALDARPGRHEIVIDRSNFPTDRYVVEGVAAETGSTVRWLEPDAAGGVTADDVRAVLGPETAVLVLSQVAYRSGHLADVPGITRLAHEHGALVLWDLCHSAGAVPIELDAWEVDLATGCTYKYLNGGPGSPAFVYVNRALLDGLRQPIQGWMGERTPFEMGQDYRPADGIRRFLSGTPPITGMIAIEAMLELIEEAGMPAIRAKSEALTAFAVRRIDEQLVPLGVELTSPRNPAARGSHVTIDHPAFPAMVPELWEQGVIPDFRRPTGIRLGFSPLSTSFAEVALGIGAIEERLQHS
ncbi:kynureninase [Herbiconiux solani]|uniref:kynureninase n=1 Tax=Herbiconiux solani TaxID=661329 RepID=UPI000826487D|nr:kynureninase [Herbiconiux solani]